MTQNGELAYQKDDTDMAQWPIQGLVYVEQQPSGGPIFYFDREVPAVQLVDDITHHATRNTHFDLYHWHEKSLTFHGTFTWDDEDGRRRFNMILQFSSDRHFISNGVLVKHSSDENNQYRYPLDENERITWTRKRDEQVMRFGAGGRMYHKQNTRKMNDYSICFVVPSCL
jgi:hypothetical protein